MKEEEQKAVAGWTKDFTRNKILTTDLRKKMQAKLEQISKESRLKISQDEEKTPSKVVAEGKNTHIHNTKRPLNSFHTHTHTYIQGTWILFLEKLSEKSKKIVDSEYFVWWDVTERKVDSFLSCKHLTVTLTTNTTYMNHHTNLNSLR